MLSALQHWAFCKRQCALIHLEQFWSENRLTAQGRLMHERAHCEQSSYENGIVVTRGLRIASRRLGMAGVADVVEFLPEADGIQLPKFEGRWRPYPVEYKLGKKKSHKADEIQLCAQAICLEEMLQCEIPSGSLFYGKTRRRSEVEFSATLREFVERSSVEVHAMLRGTTIPPPEPSQKCRSCSMQSRCMPKLTPRADAWFHRTLGKMLEDSLEEEYP